MIDVEDAEKALNYLKKTDKEAARLKAYASSMDDLKKTVLATSYCDRADGSGTEKTKYAEASSLYKNHIEATREAYEYSLIMQNQRKSCELQIEMWRSINSNQRKGNI